MVVFGWGKDYTFWTGLFNLILFSFTYWKKIDISFILLSYIAVIPFFLLSNGILTGSFLEAPVVNYNDAENLGIRIFTIPIEDTMYGFLFIALVALGYEWKKGKIINR
jgi:lycopene cyclase domain-containing protein